MSRVVSALHRPSSRSLARVLPGAKAAPFPGFIEPCLATLPQRAATSATMGGISVAVGISHPAWVTASMTTGAATPITIPTAARTDSPLA
jgi:hypothetical protein